jgi:hypothetical protein
MWAPLGNLPMLVGVSPIRAYRTLTLPAVEALTEATRGPLSEPLVQGAIWATGTSLRVFDPVENRLEQVLRRPGSRRETIEDPALARWLYGESWTEEQARWVRKFTIWRSRERPVLAWFVPVPSEEGTDANQDPPALDHWSGHPGEIVALLEGARALTAESSQPEKWMIDVESEEPGWVVVSQLADPQWTARWVGQDGQRQQALPIRPTFAKAGEPGGWLRVWLPGSGRWTLHLEYEAHDLAEGLAISMIALIVWIVLACGCGLQQWFKSPQVPERLGG